jgi:7-carboxy-7-deazaguanine synthase
MFGKNQIIKARYGDGETLRVVKIFGTIQGEGPFTGQPAIFVRLAGCNLRCWFCDTDFETNAKEMSTADIVHEINAARREVKTRLVVITGGEPLAQQLIPLCYALLIAGLDIQIETAGSVCPPDWSTVSLESITGRPEWSRGSLTIVCSPKTPKVDPTIARICKDWKYLVSSSPDDVDPADGLPFTNTQDKDGRRANLFRPPPDGGTIWIQPLERYLPTVDGDLVPDEEETKATLAFVSSLSRQYGYRISLQTHKILDVE